MRKIYDTKKPVHETYHPLLAPSPVVLDTLIPVVLLLLLCSGYACNVMMYHLNLNSQLKESINF